MSSRKEKTDRKREKVVDRGGRRAFLKKLVYTAPMVTAYGSMPKIGSFKSSGLGPPPSDPEW